MKMRRKCTISNKKKLIIAGMLSLSAAMAYFLAAVSSWIAEFVFARGIYRASSLVINTVTGILPFSVSEIIVVLLPVVIMGRVIAWILLGVKGDKEKNFRKELKDAGCTLCLIFGIVLFMYVLLCGVNYYRYSYAKINNIEVKEHSKEELYEMCKSLAVEMNETRGKLGEKYSGTDYKVSDYEMSDMVREAFAKSARDYSCFNEYTAKSKPLFVSYIFSCFNTTGIYSPFTVEALVNVHIPDYQIPATMAHEMAHINGFMREDEANYIAYLVCVNSEDVRIKYSGLSLAFTHSMNRLYEEDADCYYDVWNMLSEEILMDRQMSYEYWKNFEDTELSEMGDRINDTYLKVNSQEDGVKSYGRMVDLLLSTYYQ
ncbi:MAG: DUF3810 domain-containing protein [Lachnospiraceae bacterium]|nr:DUF3810 domain-containing protein [Lachnospiraceae bacterium]